MGAVVEVTDYHGPYPGNFVPSLLAVGRAVRQRLGLDYRVVIPEAVRDRPWTDLLRAKGIEPVVMPAAAGRREALRRLVALARECDARLLRSHFTRWDMETALAGRATGARVIWTVHTGNLGHSARQRASDLVKVRLIGRLCDRAVGVSDEIGRELRARGFPPERVTVTLNGIDLARFDDPPGRAEARAALGVPADARVVLSFGWWPYVKGVDLVLDAAPRLPGAREGRTVIVLVGEDDLERFVAARVNGDRPPWLRVARPRDEAAQLYAAADVFVLASRQEAFSYAVGEAMACRLPVVSSDIPGPSAYFPAGGVRTFRSGDAQDLAHVLGAVLDAGDAAALGDANRAFVAERLGLQRHVDSVLELFGEVLGR